MSKLFAHTKLGQPLYDSVGVYTQLADLGTDKVLA